MIESGIIVYSFILAGIISVICFGVFIWINLKDRDLDEDLYSKKKNIRNIVSKHKHTGEVEDESIDSLKKYSVSGKRSTSTEGTKGEGDAEGKDRISHRDTESAEDIKESLEKDTKENIEGEDKENSTKKYSREAKEQREQEQELEDDIISEPMSKEKYNAQFKPKK